jgi:hypothetical protein
MQGHRKASVEHSLVTTTPFENGEPLLTIVAYGTTRLSTVTTTGRVIRNNLRFLLLVPLTHEVSPLQYKDYDFLSS